MARNPFTIWVSFFGLLIGLMLAAVLLSGRGWLFGEAPVPSRPDSLRIVSLAPNLTEILFALGLQDKIVGVSSDSNFPPQAAQYKKVGSFWNPDVEAVLSVRPSLVITLGFAQQANLAALLEKAGCQTLQVDIDTIEQLYEAIQRIGRATGSQESAERLIKEIADGLEAYRGRAADCGRKVLWVVQRQPLRAAGKNTYFTELLETAGAVNAVQSAVFQYPPLSEEQFLLTGADVIIETADSPDDWQRQKASAEIFYSRFKGIPAVEQGRICIVDSDLLCRLGPRLPLAMEAIVNCICSQKLEQGKPQ